MMQNFDKMIQEKADRVFTAMGQRVSREDVTRIQEAFELARIEDETLEKDIVLKIYARLTNVFREKPCGILNYIDSPKENGYQSFHVQLLSDYGSWEEVHISSERMVRHNKIGIVAEREESNIRRWVDRFRKVLKDMEFHIKDGGFIENVVTNKPAMPGSTDSWHR